VSILPNNLDIAFRRSLVGSRIGRSLFYLRETLDIITSPRIEWGTIVNDQLASRILVELCKPGDVFIDVGAHIGSVIAKVKFKCPQARILAFEAIPAKASWLEKKFPDVTIFSCAAGERNGSVEFFIDLNQSGYSSLSPSAEKFQKVQVEMKRLDDVLEWADYIKIDVEGAELGVLRGTERIISECRPVIMFESGPGSILSYTKSDLFKFFDKFDFGIMAPNRIAHTGGFMSLDAFLDSHEYPRRTTNYFAIPREKLGEIRAFFDHSN